MSYVSVQVCYTCKREKIKGCGRSCSIRLTLGSIERKREPFVDQLRVVSWELERTTAAE